MTYLVYNDRDRQYIKYFISHNITVTDYRHTVANQVDMELEDLGDIAA